MQVNPLRELSAVLRCAQNPHVLALACTFRFLRSVRLAYNPLATVYKVY